MRKKKQVNFIRDLILARGRINKHKYDRFDLNITSFTSLHFQVVLLAPWSLLPFEQRVPLYWIGKNPPGEGFGSSSLCSRVGTHLITTYMLILTYITLTQIKFLQANINQSVYFQCSKYGKRESVRFLFTTNNLLLLCFIKNNLVLSLSWRFRLKRTLELQMVASHFQ